MKSLLALAIETAKKHGASYAEARIIRRRDQTLHAQNERINHVGDSESAGAGIRVLYRGAWGFAATPVLDSDSIRAAARRAVEIARASASTKKGKGVILADEPAYIDAFQNPIRKDPFKVPLETKINTLLAINGILRKKKAIKRADAMMRFSREDKLFASSIGTMLDLTHHIALVSFTATAVDNNDMKQRTYGPPPMAVGYEIVEDAPLLTSAVRVREEAIEHIYAAECPKGLKDLVLDPVHLALTIHESVGHATELDRALGYEANFAGTSFAVPKLLGKLKYGSDIVNFTADNTLPNGLATYGYDDEGVKAQKWDIVRDGLFVGYGTSRETAPTIRLKRSTGSARADSFNSVPINRIPNLSLMPGKKRCSPDDIIKDTKDGIYIEGRGSYSIDQRRYNFQFGGDAFWEIKNGRKTRMLKNVTYQSITPEFWGAMDAIADERFWVQEGVVNCGKGEPMQISQMSHGSATARFRKIRVGGAK
jgi:TldD protein